MTWSRQTWRSGDEIGQLAPEEAGISLRPRAGERKYEIDAQEVGHATTPSRFARRLPNRPPGASAQQKRGTSRSQTTTTTATTATIS